MSNNYTKNSSLSGTVGAVAFLVGFHPTLLNQSLSATKTDCNGETALKEKFTIITIFSMLFGIILPIARPVVPQISAKPAIELTSFQTPAKFALLVGITDYTSQDIRDLRGGENDVKLMREMLSELYGFTAGTDIKELLSSSPQPVDKPTQKAILDNFDRHLIENAKKYFADKKLSSPDKGASVVFYYSGHGSHLPDDDGDEADGRDETIVPMDADLIGTKDIRDDEFDRRFSELKKYTTNITFIFDSCHSGTITRGLGTRSLERPAVKAKAKTDGADVTLNENISSTGANYVTISGSLPNQKAYENLLPNQNDMRRKAASPKMETNGYLTYYLVQTLREMPGATYRDVMKRVGAAVQKRNSEQHPQVEGDVNRSVFGAAISGGKNTIDILKVKKDDKATILTIAAGKIVGAFPGGVVSIYKQAGDAERLAVGEIIEPTDDFTATVKVSETEVPITAGVILATPFFGNNKRIVALDLTPKMSKELRVESGELAEKDDAGLRMIKRLVQKLENNDYVSARLLLDPLRENQKNWNIAIIRSFYGEFKKGNPQFPAKDSAVPKDEEEIYYLSSVNGNPLYNFWVKAADANAVEAIQTALETYVRVDNLRTLGNEASEINKGLDIKIIKLKALKTPLQSIDDVVEDGILQNPVLSVGDLFSFEITNKTGQPLFVYLYSIGTDGKVQLFYGPKTDGDKLPDNKTMKMLNAELIAEATPPYGVETFKLIAASRLFDGKLLEGAAIERQRSGALNPLESLLAQAGTNTRGLSLVTFEFNGWATTSLDIEIKEK